MLEGHEKNAWLVVGDQEIAVPNSQLKPQDIICVKVGSKLPVDGTVISGTASVNQAVLTGEPVPILRQPGDPVLAGSTVEQGTLYVRVEKVGDNTAVARIIHLVEEASQSRAPIQKIADRYSARIIPFSFLFAALIRTMTILIVACPCAAGLATPTALCAAIGNAANRGILVKGGRYLEEAGRIDTILFDKTGTLTSGHPVVTDVIPLEAEMTVPQLLALAATAESNANHPLAEAVKTAARQANISFRHLPTSEMSIGKGVHATIDDHHFYVGSSRYMTELAVVIPPLDNYISRIPRDATYLYVARSAQLIGIIAVRDTMRPEAPAAIAALRVEGVTTIGIVTGDTDIAAQEIANAAGITSIWSGMLPQDKFQLIKTFQHHNAIVGMVGDGINDSPALALANVGIAMGAGGSDAAIETAGIVLREDNPMKIIEVVRLGKKSLSAIHQNFLLAIGANIIGLALGSLRIISPFWAAILHNTSTLAVVLNSARLLTYNPCPLDNKKSTLRK
jgi:cation-transporting P-type ATPase C